MAEGITVNEVAKELGVELETHSAWSVGQSLVRQFQAENGALPPKDLRPKKNGGGKHCFAIYPLTWRPRIVEAIRAAHPTTTRQASLF
jgi:hypothetical protein